MQLSEKTEDQRHGHLPISPLRPTQPPEVSKIESLPNRLPNKLSLLETENCCDDIPSEPSLKRAQNEGRNDPKRPNEQYWPLRKRPKLDCYRPGPLSAKRRWISKAMKRTNPLPALVKLRPCFVPLESEKAVCQAFIAEFKKIKARRKKPCPSPEFILRPPLRMLE